MGKITQKDIDKLPKSEKKKIDKAKKEIAKTMPKVSKKVKDDAKVIAIEQLSKDLDKLGNWIADVDDDLKEVSDLVDRLAKRMGLYE